KFTVPGGVINSRLPLQVLLSPTDWQKSFLIVILGCAFTSVEEIPTTYNKAKPKRNDLTNNLEKVLGFIIYHLVDLFIFINISKNFTR
ncbi:MAG: hypothetical protein M3521_15115, partial [Acidobacteriota bacterium]|nr:hypothetical protein [Acidobacteriota bacterium]